MDDATNTSVRRKFGNFWNRPYNRFFFNKFVYIFFLQSLKCKTGVHQANDQYQKIMQMCKKRSTTDNDYSNDSSSEDDDDKNGSSSVDLFGAMFFTNGGNKFSMQSWKESNENR